MKGHTNSKNGSRGHGVAMLGKVISIASSGLIEFFILFLIEAKHFFALINERRDGEKRKKAMKNSLATGRNISIADNFGNKIIAGSFDSKSK